MLVLLGMAASGCQIDAAIGTVSRAIALDTVPENLATDQLTPVTERTKHLGVDTSVFNQMVDEAFHAQYLELNGRSLTLNKADAEWRSRWLELADGVLDSIEHLSPEVYQQLGQYRGEVYQQWQAELAQYPLSPQAFVYLIDARFQMLFPQYSGKELNPHGAGQLWFAVADEMQQDIYSGESLEVIHLDRPAPENGYA